MKHLAPLRFLIALVLLPACQSSSSSGGDDTDTGSDTSTDADADADTETDTGPCVPDTADLWFGLVSVGGMEFVPGRGYHLADGVFTVTDWGTELCGVELEDAQLDELMQAAESAIASGILVDIAPEGLDCGADTFNYELVLDMPPCSVETFWCAHLPELLTLPAQEFVELVEEIGDEIALGC